VTERIRIEGALDFVRRHGVVLASARGPVPSLAEAVAGAAIRGSWWSHPRARAIFQALEQIAARPEVLVCRLLGGKRTFVHRRLWPALVRVADRFPRARIARVIEEHTERGHHRARLIPFPDWVPQAVRKAARNLSESRALRALGEWTGTA
jgi:hypothetical protein